MAAIKKNIVVLGGSYGGISAAHNILKHTLPNLPNKEAYQVIMISAAAEAMCRPGCPRALISDEMFDQSRFFVSVPEQFEQYPKGSFRFIQGTAVQLDHQNRTLAYSVAGGPPEQIPFYALVIATGASTPSPLFSFNKDEKLLRANWATFRAALPSAKSIVIAGGGPTGIETAGELGEYLNGRAGYFSAKLENPKVVITVVTGAPNILPILRPSIAEKAERMLAKVGVTVIKDARVQSVSPADSGSETNVATKTTITLEGGKTLEADIYIPAFGMTYNTSFVPKELLTPEGRIDTNPSTLRVDKAGPRIYAVGDVASATRPAVHHLLAEIPVLSANIKRDLLMGAGVEGASLGEDRVFVEDTKETQMVPIGRSKGVGAGGGFAMPSWAVWLIKGRDYWLWTTGSLWNGKQWSNEK
ncbi:FAD/NAD(P)-binding domain-containing protein [Coniochaeta ligniaria NRRL 30616]|uniref:FAD/NAD(P)-binding domain-containing protein n=1 Tax=Coniochaeta ligniaria NRRL 30616 TaxID=1408157 RepID=A0A1J7IUB0_9PEZI|nr:FAD/NAD(P)-binding domain-containing protein [Coniochaeta ligniaria NRRL 30616]